MPLSAIHVNLRRVASLNSPIAMATRAGRREIWIAERGGRVRVFDPVDSSVSPPIIDISASISNGGERGLLGLTFSPDGTRLYLSYTNTDGNTRIDEYTMNGDTVNVASRRNIFALTQPFPNHNGGNVIFGPDGYLWFGLGDGGSQNDPNNNGQNPNVLLASILRLNPLSPTNGAYGIPADNPYVNGGALPEIWIKGVRNPWRFSFDRATGDLWIADVGGDAREEIDLLPAPARGKGANLEWPLYEGTRRNKGDHPAGGVPPIFDYDHSNGNCSIVGGYVYRGAEFPTLRGVYVFGDYCRSEIVLLRSDGKSVETRGTGVIINGTNLASFGEGPDGALYALSLSGGVFKVEVT